MEQRDLYNANRELVNKTIFKDQEIPEGYYIIVVMAFIQNSEGKFLIQKRSEEKGGEWAFTGGHPKTGETSLQGLYTEVKEELGIDSNEPILFKQAQGKNVFCDLYYIKQDINVDDMVIQKEEVSEVRLATEEEINKLFESNKFKKNHYMMFKDCLKYLKEFDNKKCRQF